MKEIKAIIQPFMVEEVLHGLDELDDLPGVTISEVAGWGKTRADGAADPVEHAGHTLARKSKLEIVVPDGMLEPVVGVIEERARTGNPGDGKIFVLSVEQTVKVRTGERGEVAI